MARRPLLVALAWIGLQAVGAAQRLPDGFVRQRIASFAAPIALAYLDEERLLVAERPGRVWYVERDVKRNLVYDLRAETQDTRDRGLLGIAVAPDFDRSGWIYLLHVVNVAGQPANGPTYSRLVRVRAEYDAAGDLVALPETREVLLGDSWSTGIPACYPHHALGSVRLLSDGSLVLSTGDNADLFDAGGSTPGCFGPGRTSPDQDVGAFRAQSLDSLGGKVLRLDPATGAGLPDNPFYTGNPFDERSRVWAHGLRNPFRFTTLPGTGPREALLIADVGWDDWEEIDLCFGGENFGWPCHEGAGPAPWYPAIDPRGFCGGWSQTPPILAWHHTEPSAAGFSGNCASALCVYRGQRYPSLYHGRLFFFDFERNWLRAAELDESLRIRNTLVFGTQLSSPVELVAQPGTGDLVYIAQGYQSGGVFRIRHVGNQQPPVAAVSAAPSYGLGDLDVTLDGRGSRDPDGLPLAFAWDLGDGTSATEAVVTHLYPAGAAYTARLTVTDAEGLTDSAEVRITPGNTPPRILALRTPLDGGLYVADEPLRLEATAEDDQDGAALAAAWRLDLAHGHHVHPGYATAEGLEASVVPEGHDSGDNHFLVRLAVTDSSGLVDERAVEVFDAHSLPVVHLVALATSEVRVGQTLAPVGHVDYSAGRALAKQASLAWDWGDGTRDEFPDARHQVDTRPTHVYRQAGSYKLRLSASLGGSETSAEVVSIRVAAPRPSVAVFAALDDERWIARAEQEAIVAALRVALAQRASEVRAYHLGQGAELAAWMESLASDPLADVVVLLDFLPSTLIEGGLSGSLLERWVAGRNGLVWTGITPLHNVLSDDGTDVMALGIPETFFGSTLPDLVLGAGLQRPTLLGQSLLPSLATYSAERALRTDQLGPAWRVARLFASDLDQDSDALELEHVPSGGFYAQLLCASASGLPRAAVLSEYLAGKLGRGRSGTGPAPVRR